MDFSKISSIASNMQPAEWNGKFEENKITENIIFKDGSKMSLVIELETVSDKMFGSAQNIINGFIDDEEEYEEEYDDEFYVMVEENGNSFPIHKDVLDVYIELMES